MTDPTRARVGAAASSRTPRGWWARPVDGILLSLGPIVLAIVVTGVLIALLGRDPVTFYQDMVVAGLLRRSGLEDTIERMAPILLIGAGLIVAFRGSLWNLGGDGQYLLALATVAGIAPTILASAPPAVGWVLLGLAGAAVGGAWTLVPAVLKARYGLNEIVTTLMMTFIGIGLANLLVKYPFRGPTVVPQTEVWDTASMLVSLPGTAINVGVLAALAIVLLVHALLTGTSFGTRLDVLGANQRAAIHLGVEVPRMTVLAFFLSGALIGLAAAVDFLGIFGYMRADQDPAYALKVVPLVFLARLNVIALIPFAALFGVLSIGGEYAARRAEMPNVFLLLLVGMVLLFMVVIHHLADRRSRGLPLVPGWPRPSAPEPGGSDA